jgi:hypothetical protein
MFALIISIYLAKINYCVVEVKDDSSSAYTLRYY